jgi:hypothetical protein
LARQIGARATQGSFFVKGDVMSAARELSRLKHEKRGDQTGRNKANRAKKKKRAHYKEKYPGVKTAKWPSKLSVG